MRPRAIIRILLSLWLAMGQSLCFANACLAESVLNQAPPIKVNVLTFTDESGAGASSGLSELFAWSLANQLFTSSNGRLAAGFFSPNDNLGNPISTREWDTQRLVTFGQKFGTQFVIRPGLLSASTEDSDGGRKAKFKLYADVVSVEKATLDRVEAENVINKKQRDSDFSTPLDLTGLRVDEFISATFYPVFLNSIQRLARSVYKTIL